MKGLPRIFIVVAIAVLVLGGCPCASDQTKVTVLNSSTIYTFTSLQINASSTPGVFVVNQAISLAPGSRVTFASIPGGTYDIRIDTTSGGIIQKTSRLVFVDIENIFEFTDSDISLP